MTKIAKLKKIIKPAYPVWAEAEIIAEPVKDRSEPTLLVRRRKTQMLDRYGFEFRAAHEYSVISLFTGAGGFDLGMEQAGYHTLCQVELDYWACQTLICNRPTCFRDAALIQGDIRRIRTSDILRECGLYVGEPFMVIGGSPCQGFSRVNSNANQGKYDSRNDLTFEYLRVVRESQPTFFAFENVPGFMRFKGEINGQKYHEAFLAEAYRSGYELVYGLINCAEYGVPQNRIRFICFGTRRDKFEIDGILGSLPAPQYFGSEDLQQIELYENSLFPEQADLIKHPPGVRYFPDREVLRPPAPVVGCETGGGRTKPFLDFYENLLKNEPDRLCQPIRE